MESPEGRNGYYVPLVYVVNPRPLVSNGLWGTGLPKCQEIKMYSTARQCSMEMGQFFLKAGGSPVLPKNLQSNTLI